MKTQQIDFDGKGCFIYFKGGIFNVTFTFFLLVNAEFQHWKLVLFSIDRIQYLPLNSMLIFSLQKIKL